MPAATTKILEDAFGEMARSPSFVEDAQRADIEVSPVSGVELKSMFADFLNARAGVKKELALLVQ